MTNPTATHAATVLLVDNEPAICALMARTLTAHGYGVLQAHSGKEAADFAKDHDGPIHLLVTDVMMPGISGFDLADAVVAARPETQVLFISGHVDDSVAVRERFEKESPCFLVKPFTADVLIRRVQAILEPR
jgi:DNA-binding response OmpR family regulator